MPLNETARLEFLNSLQILNSGPDELLDRVAQAAADICETPIGLITLVGSDRQWFKARYGLDTITETPRDVSFCGHTILGCDVFEVPDTSLDARFADNPLTVGEPYVRFYAGAPISVGDGLPIGTVCVIDREPRRLNAHQTRAIEALAEIAKRIILGGVGADVPALSNVNLIDSAPAMMHSISLSGTLVAVSDLWLKTLGYARHEVIGRKSIEFLTEESRVFAYNEVLPRFFKEGSCHDVPYQMVKKNGEVIDVQLSAVLERDENLEPTGSLAIINDITEKAALSAALEQANSDLRAIFSNVPARLGYWDSKLIGRWLNKQYETLLGPEPDRLLGKSLEEVLLSLPPRHYAELWPRVQKALAGERQEFEFHYEASHGVVFEQITYVPDVGSDGEIRGFYVLAYDITSRKQIEDRLQTSEAQYRLLFENMQTGFAHHRIMLDASGVPVDFRFLSLNPAFTRMTDLQPETTIGRSFLEILPSSNHNPIDWISTLGKVALTGEPSRTEHFSEETSRWYEAVAYQTAPMEFAVTLQDVTDRRMIQSILEREHERLRVTLQSIGDAVITTDTSGRVEYLNPIAERLTGWTLEKAVGLALPEVFHIIDETTRVAAVNPVDRVLQEDGVVEQSNHTLLISSDGTEFAIEDSAAPIRNANGKILGAVLVFRDVTEQRSISRHMTHQATHDPLTGIFNRAEFEIRLATAFEESRDEGVEHSLLYIDLDQFKQVNDACGHSVGDVLLQRIASLIESCVRSGDTFARLGGDEFAVILNKCPLSDGLRVAQNIRKRVEEYRFVHDNRRFRIGASIGLVPVNHIWADTGELLQAADAACYSAKAGGRNRVHAYFDLDDHIKIHQGDVNWAARLEKALDSDQFELLAQTIMPLNPETDRIGCEIFVRMRGEDGALTPPAIFIPAAERFHLASRLDRWVTRRTVDLMKKHPGGGERLDFVCINLSTQSIGDRELQLQVEDWACDHAAPLNKLCFEFSEGAVVSCVEDAATFMGRLGEYGVRFSLDEIGGGTSSFGFLKSLPVDFLKIDGPLIQSVLEDAVNYHTVECITAIAKSLGRTTVGECVEDQEVLAKIREMGLDFAQGHYLQPLRPFEELLSDLTNP